MNGKSGKHEIEVFSFPFELRFSAIILVNKMADFALCTARNFNISNKNFKLSSKLPNFLGQINQTKLVHFGYLVNSTFEKRRVVLILILQVPGDIKIRLRDPDIKPSFIHSFYSLI